MINQQLLNPQSIVIVGGSNDPHKPGGKVLKNILSGQYKGKLYVTNPKEDLIQGIKSYKNPSELPDSELAIIAIAAKYCVDTVRILAEQKNTRAFIILSAGFSEVGDDGKKIEDEIVQIINSVNGVLIGPNGIGVLNTNYNGVFTEPIPKLDPKGVDFISGSGATAVFILETGIARGLSFASIYSVGNSAQIGVEEVLKYMDENYVEGQSSTTKLLYMEKIDKPQILLKHASSLINKGCKIAAIKSGSSEAGSRAASSHTGALASSDVAVDALFRKAGIVRCSGRQELVTVASVFMQPAPKGKNVAIITHAGGPAVMLTDTLEKGGMQVPHLDDENAKKLLSELFDGSSVSNPIDFLATGTAQQLGTIIDYSENKFNQIDAMTVIFGTPGLVRVFDAYEVIHEKMKNSKKPIYPILPSTMVAKEEINVFLSKGHVYFPDEVVLGNALTKVYHTPKPSDLSVKLPEMDTKIIRETIENTKDGYISPKEIQTLLDAAGIERAKEAVVQTEKTALTNAHEIGYPLVMKVVGPVHKSDIGGVVLDVQTDEQLISEFQRMMQIKDTTAILLQPMLSGIELFAGAKYEDNFGHMILAGMGGIFIEVLKDISTELLPLSKIKAMEMIKNLKSYKIIEGIRGQEGINQNKFAEIIYRLAALLTIAPEIKEMDLNPLLGSSSKIVAVDARIRIEK